MKNIAILASGEGTNAENIISYFKKNKTVNVSLLIYNKKEAGAAKRAERMGVKTEYRSKKDFEDSVEIISLLKNNEIDVIVLSGFLLLVPEYLLKAYPNKILNIHPSLIPKHCGKGMYGMKVHQDVVDSRDRQTGITIHIVDENFDTGTQLFQASCAVAPEDSPLEVAQKVHALEYKYFPEVIENFCLNL